MSEPVWQSRVSRLRLGDIMLAAKLITREQLNEALEMQQSSGGRLGENLVKLGHVAESDLNRTLAKQLGLAFDEGPELNLDPATSRLIAEDVATKFQVLPLKLEGNLLRVAVVDPLNFQAVDNVALQTGRQVTPVVVTRSTLQRALIRVYGIPDVQPDEEISTRLYNVDVPEENTVVRLVNTVLTQAIVARASDIHMEPTEDRSRVRYRVDGVLLETTPIPLNLHGSIISRLKVMGGMDIAERRIPQDGQIQITSKSRRYDLRVNTLPTIHGERVAIRILDRNSGLKAVSQLGLPPPMDQTYMEMIHRPNGIILITGPTGSGKSTTLMATLSEINKAEKHIMTIEDPVEYHIAGISQVQVNNKAGLNFASGLRSFLRQDPDVIMVGEIRDGETADIAIRAALTGHLVFSTLHTNQAAATVGRLIDMGIEPFLLASSLLGIMAQRLVRLLCKRCRQPYIIPDDDPARFLPGVPEGPLQLHRAKGCGFCEHTGYQGRYAIFELLQVTGEVRELIMKQAPASAIQAAARRHGMRTLWDTGLEKVLAGETSIEELQRVAFMEA